MPTATGQAQDHFAKIGEHSVQGGTSDRLGSVYRVWRDGHEQVVQPIIGFDVNGNPVHGPYCHTRDHRGSHSEEKKYHGGDPGEGMNCIIHSTGADPRKAILGAGAEQDQEHYAPDQAGNENHSYQYAAARKDWWRSGHHHWSAKNGKRQGGATNSDNGNAVGLFRLGTKFIDSIIHGPWRGPSPEGGNPFGGWLNKMMSQIMHKTPFADKANNMMSMLENKGMMHGTNNQFTQSSLGKFARSAGVGLQSNSAQARFGDSGGDGVISDKATKAHSFHTPSAGFWGDVNIKSECTAPKFQVGGGGGDIGAAFGSVKYAPARHGLATLRKLADHTHEFVHPATMQYHFGINTEVLRQVAPELVGGVTAIFADNITSPTTRESWTPLAEQFIQDHYTYAGSDATPPAASLIVDDLVADGPEVDTTVVVETQTFDAVDLYGTLVMTINAVNDQQNQIDQLLAQLGIDETKQATDEATIAAQALQISSLQQQALQLYTWMTTGTLPIFFLGASSLAANAAHVMGLFAGIGDSSSLSVDNSNVIQGRYGFFYGRSVLKAAAPRMRQRASGSMSGRAGLAATATGVPGMFWNRADEAQINIDPTGLYATSSSALRGGVRCTVGASTGKVYWEVYAYSITGGNWNSWATGMANKSFSLSDPVGLGSNANSFGYYPQNGSLWFNGVAAAIAGTLPVVTGGGNISIAVDLGSRLVWIGFNPGTGLVWYPNGANPALGTGGISLAGMTNDLYYPAFGVAALNQEAEARFRKSSWVHASPAGFSSLA